MSLRVHGVRRSVDGDHTEGVTRLPDFVIIGAMKAGTTTLFRWLDEQDEVSMPAVKEPEFFVSESDWAAGVPPYAEHFSSVAQGQLTGEASTAYSDPELAAIAAGRMVKVVPSVKLIFVAREPVARARSHYRHEVQRGREQRHFVEALADPSNPYVRRSLYSQGLAPFMDRFPADQLLVVGFEDLVGADFRGWGQITEFLGLTSRPPPGDAHNVTADKAGFTGPMRWLFDRGWAGPPSGTPSWLRRAGASILLRHDRRYHYLLNSSREPLPPPASTRLREERSDLAALLGGRGPNWDGHFDDTDLEDHG